MNQAHDPARFTNRTTFLMCINSESKTDVGSRSILRKVLNDYAEFKSLAIFYNSWREYKQEKLMCGQHPEVHPDNHAKPHNASDEQTPSEKHGMDVNGWQIDYVGSKCQQRSGRCNIIIITKYCKLIKIFFEFFYMFWNLFFYFCFKLSFWYKDRIF